MGTGCYYTNKETGTRAFWIDIDPYYEDDNGDEIYDEWIWEDTCLNLQSELEYLGYQKETNLKFYNGLYNLILEGGYGSEIVIRLEPRITEAYYYEDVRLYNLALANHDRCYDRIAKYLHKMGYPLRIATSGYTSCKYDPY